MDTRAIRARYLGKDYGIKLTKGTVEDLRTEGSASVFRLRPQNERVAVTIG